MPGMPRISKKTAQIAYDVIGMPDNMKKVRGDKEADRRLLLQKTKRVR